MLEIMLAPGVPLGVPATVPGIGNSEISCTGVLLPAGVYVAGGISVIVYVPGGIPPSGFAAEGGGLNVKAPLAPVVVVNVIPAPVFEVPVNTIVTPGMPTSVAALRVPKGS